MKLFIAKLVTAFLFLACILVVESILTGTLPMAGGLMVLAVCSISTFKFLEISLRKPARRKHITAGAHPALRVQQGGQFPGGPRAA